MAEGTDRVLASLAQRQHGVVAAGQLLALGISRRAIEVRLAAGRLHRVHRGVYAVGHRLLDDYGRSMAAVLACGAGTVLSHRSAGKLLGLLRHGPSWPEVSRSRGLRSRSRIVIHRVRLEEDEVTEVAGIPVTGLSRTLFDLAADSSQSQMEQALNEAEVQGLTDRVSIPALLERYPRRVGGALLKRLIRDDDAARGVTRKELERRFKELLAGTDLPRPRLNADVAVGGQFFEVDCLWSAQRLIVELDGRAVHGTRRAFERDRERDRLLVADGWRVVRITWRQLRDDAPRLVSDLRRLLSKR